MPNTTSATWPALTAGRVARASDVESKFDWSEFHLWPHASGSFTSNTFDLGNSTTAYWRTAWLFSINATTSAQGLAIGTTTVNNNSSTALEIAGSRAVLLPRLTTVQRDALTPTNGMLVYNSTPNQFQGYENGAWRIMQGQAIGIVTKVVASTGSALTQTAVSISSAGRVRSVLTNSSLAGDNRVAVSLDSVTTSEISGNTTTTEALRLANTVSSQYFLFLSASSSDEQNLDLYFKSSLDIFYRSATGGGTTGVAIIYERT